VITHTQKTANGIPPALRTDAVSVIRAAHRHHHIPIAAAVARTAWRAPTAREDLDWSREIAQHGEQAAITARQPELLIELLNSSAETYSAAADWPGAERAWLRALAVVEHLNDTTRSVHFLHLLATNYLNWERPHKALDMLLEITEIHERVNEPIKTAQTQAQVAHIMANAGRPDAAIDYLGRADRLLRARPHINPEVTSLRAIVLSDLGQLHAQMGKINNARSCYHQALALVIDTDDQAAELIRSLQAALQAQRLS
jgi:tetratricopeptide (TPR) repeat protein